MDEKKLTQLVKKTLDIIEDAFQTVEIKNVSTEQEINMLAHLAPVILTELIQAEKAKG